MLVATRILITSWASVGIPRPAKKQSLNLLCARRSATSVVVPYNKDQWLLIRKMLIKAKIGDPSMTASSSYG